MSLIQATAIPFGAEDFTLDQSLKFDQSNATAGNYNSAASVSKTPSSASNRKTWTFSAWIKIGFLTTQNRAEFFYAYNPAATNWYDDALTLSIIGCVFRVDCSSGATCSIKSNQVFRDPSAWYHIMVVWDTTQGTNTNRIKVYINGVQITSWSEATWPGQNTDGWVNYTGPHHLGRGGNVTVGTYGFSGLMAEVHFIDGTALTTASFGETGTYGEWKPIEVSDLTYGNNGFYLPFKAD